MSAESTMACQIPPVLRQPRLVANALSQWLRRAFQRCIVLQKKLSVGIGLPAHVVSWALRLCAKKRRARRKRLKSLASSATDVISCSRQVRQGVGGIRSRFADKTRQYGDHPWPLGRFDTSLPGGPIRGHPILLPSGDTQFWIVRQFRRDRRELILCLLTWADWVS